MSLGWLLLRLASSNSGSVTRTGLLVHGLELITEFAGAPALLSSAGQQQARRSSIYSVVVVACTIGNLLRRVPAYKPALTGFDGETPLGTDSTGFAG